jgi:probable O-glycosylation ligase (exosortase A-associated)
MRDYIILFFTSLFIPAGLYNPFYGLLGFSWLAYMRPQDLAWGLAASYRLSYYTSLATLFGVIIHGKSRTILSLDKIAKLLLIFWIWLGITTLFAVSIPVAQERLKLISKIMVISFISMGLIDNRKKLRWSLIVIGGSLGFLGFKYGFYGLLHEGVRFKSGPGGLIGDNNDFALALSMNLPILWYLSKETSQNYLKMGWIILFLFSIMTILLTYSRGGFLALVVATGLILLRRNNKLTSLIIIAVSVILFYHFVPNQYMQRLSTIRDYEIESSARGRINAWKTGYQMFLDNPLTGVGLENFEHVYFIYSPNSTDSRVAHNTYIQLLSESGFPAIFLYTTLIGMTIVELRKMRKESEFMKNGDIWIINYSNMLEISIITFLVGATFLNRAHFDLFYHLIALSICLKVIARKNQIAH